MPNNMTRTTRSLIGQKAPDFTLESADGEMISLSDFDGQWKVVFFYALNGSPTIQHGQPHEQQDEPF